MSILFVFLGIVAVIYILALCITAKILYDDYKGGKMLPLIPKGSDKVLYLFFPVYVPFLILSIKRRKSNRKFYNHCRSSVLEEFFCNDLDKLIEFENFVTSRCGTFDVCIYYVFDNIKKLQKSEITSDKLYRIVSKLFKENNVILEKDTINLVAYELLSCYYEKRFKETNTQRIMRLRKAGYNVRPRELGRDEEKHTIKCDFEGIEEKCPKNCDSCFLRVFDDAAMCQIDMHLKEAIEKYRIVVQEEPGFAEAWNNLAYTYREIGEHSLALDSFLKAIDIDPMFGRSLWGAAMELRKLGRDGEAMTVLYDLLKYYDYPDANNAIAELKKKGVSPIALCRNLDINCQKQIALIANYFGLEPSGNPNISLGAKSIFDEIYSPFFDCLAGQLVEIDVNKLSKVTSEFMLLAGMASSKIYYTEKEKFLSEGIVKLLSSQRGLLAMDEFCCDYLQIQYEPGLGNALSQCLEQMTQEANRIFSDIINQIKTIPQIKVLVHDISFVFFSFGFSYIELKIKNSYSINIQPKKLTRRDVLALRLKSMANDPSIKPKEPVSRHEGAMCYSISTEQPKQKTWWCERCFTQFDDTPNNEVVRYYKEIRKMGYDCNLQRLCKDCCNKYGFFISPFSNSGFVFSIRLDTSEQYRQSVVDYDDLQILYQFLKNENKYGHSSFVGESTHVVERLLGLENLK